MNFASQAPEATPGTAQMALRAKDTAEKPPAMNASKTLVQRMSHTVIPMVVRISAAMSLVV